MRRQSGHISTNGRSWYLRYRKTVNARRKLAFHILGPFQGEENPPERIRAIADRILHEVNREFRRKYLGSGKSIECVARNDEVCPICEIPGRKLVIDHDHITGEFRGLLCRTCNSGIGMMKDNPVILLRAYKYLQSVTCNA